MPSIPSLTAIKPVITDVLQALDAVGVSMAAAMGGIGGHGFMLLSVLFGIMFFYQVFLFMLDADSKIMVDITKLTMTWAILAAMLAGWTSPIGGIGPTSTISVSGFFLKAIPSISEKFTGGNDATPTIVDLHAAAITSLFRVLSPPEESKQKISDKLINAVPIFGFSTVAHAISGIAATGNAFENSDFFSKVVSVLLLLLAAFFTLWSLLTYVFVLNAGQLMMYVGLGLGPILIPFLLIPKLSFLFDGWLKFMISASLYKVVAVMVGLLAIGTLNVIVGYANAASTSDESIIFLSLMVLFFAMLGKQMMGLADNMASSLASGGSSSGGAGDSHALIMGAAKTKNPSKDKRGDGKTDSQPAVKSAAPSPTNNSRS